LVVALSVGQISFSRFHFLPPLPKHNRQQFFSNGMDFNRFQINKRMKGGTPTCMDNHDMPHYKIFAKIPRKSVRKAAFALSLVHRRPDMPRPELPRDAGIVSRHFAESL
jgi:hypothetical protein